MLEIKPDISRGGMSAIQTILITFYRGKKSYAFKDLTIYQMSD